MTVDDVMDWLRRSDGRIEDIFGLWVQGKRDARWLGERLIEEGHLAALASESSPGLDVERLYDVLLVVTRPRLFPGDKGADAWRRRTAEAIAAEYARLASPEPDRK